MPRLKRFFRHWKWFWQRRTWGFDERELWSLDLTIANFILPRLIKFREYNSCHPGTLTTKQWNQKLDDMIFTFKKVSSQFESDMDEEDCKRANRGMIAFKNWFNALWY